MCTGAEAAMVGGTALSIGGSLSAGKAAKKAGRASADARIAEAKARAKAIRKARGEVMAEATVAQAASGVSVTDGGTTDIVQREIAKNAEYDALNELLAGQRDAAALRKGGQAAARASVLNAAAIGLDAYSGWKRAAKGTT